MSLAFILVFSACGLLIGWLRPPKVLTPLALGVSLLSIFWLQPLSPIRNLDFWLPLASIALTVWVWAITYPESDRPLRLALPGLLVILGVTLGIAATRYLEALCCLTPARPPQIQLAGAGIGVVLLVFGLLYWGLPARRGFAALPVGLLIAVFVLLKNENLAEWVSVGLRSLTGQPPELAAPSDLTWVGFSFLAFRLLHAARDRQANRLPPASLSEFATYALFFPAFISGPIDRSQHFIAELRKAGARRSEPGWKAAALQNNLSGFQRILIGSFKKIVLADSLALIALNPANALQITSPGWMWALLLAFSLRIYFDFSGYTDIAVGVSRLMGISLPENFERPYLKTSLTAFWNSWHITLAQWFRSYVFNPFTRFLRTGGRSTPVWAVILAGQMLTMALIGIWHGLSWNFLIWGIWHGGGLFVQNRWSEWARPRLDESRISPAGRAALQAGGWFATFGFVCLGWVWFALPSPELALEVFRTLFGGTR